MSVAVSACSLTAALVVAGQVLAAAGQSSKEPWPEHDQAMRRAQVWVKPRVPIESVQFAANPDDRFRPDQVVHCRFAPSPTSGNTPKFDCTMADGESLKVKYGASNPEIFAEVIATRLLSALGFPTDHMHVVGAVECAGCPRDPFKALDCLGREGATVRSCFGDIDYRRTRTFSDAVIERRLAGRPLESGKRRGWAWHELANVDPQQGGASRAEVDAFRLLAAFLAHWDNKSENQRLVCLDEDTVEYVV